MVDEVNNNLEKTTGCVVLDEVLDIASASDLRTKLVQIIGLDQTVSLDASSVTRADTAALQILSAFIQDARLKQQEIHWKEPSRVLCQSAELLGLVNIMGLETGMCLNAD